MKYSSKQRSIGPAQRGQIVQRIIVDGWSTAAAAAAFHVPKRLVEAWLSDYRRHGMQSLRHRPRKSVIAEMVRLKIVEPVLSALHLVAVLLHPLETREPHVQPLPLRRSRDERRGGGTA
ncbi:MAG TPA: helix-turn-helix domain-containing protein [Stellaceae bacterium]|jgi:transposase-like protein